MGNFWQYVAKLAFDRVAESKVECPTPTPTFQKFPTTAFTEFPTSN